MLFNLLDWRGRARRIKTRRYLVMLAMLGIGIALSQAWIASRHQARLIAAEQTLKRQNAEFDTLNQTLDRLTEAVADQEARAADWTRDIDTLTAIASMTEPDTGVLEVMIRARPNWVWLDRATHYLIQPSSPDAMPTRALRVEGRGLTAAEVLAYQARLAERLPHQHVELLDQQQNAQGLSRFVLELRP